MIRFGRLVRLALLVPFAAAAQETVLYVSPQGNDAGAGTEAAPFATPARARDALRERRKAGSLHGPATVRLRGGTYELADTLVLGHEDSGTTFEAYRGETPVLSGGRAIRGWKRMGQARGRTPGQLWTAEAKWDFHQLFVNGERRRRARTPSEGFLYMEGAISLGQPCTIHYREGDFRPAWAKSPGAEIVILTKWLGLRMPIESVDEATRTITLAGSYLLRNYEEPGARYYVENNPESLDAPGEWYLDRQAGVVSYRNLADEDPSQAEIVAPALAELVRLDGTENVHLRGLTFVYADWVSAETQGSPQASVRVGAAIESSGARSCSVERCTLRHLGRYAIQFGKGAKDDRVVANEISDTGAGGVKIGLGAQIAQGMRPVPPELLRQIQDEDAAAGGNVVSDNRIHDIGNVFPDAVGIWVGQSHGNTIAHNEIHDTYYSGISVGWTWGFLPTAARDNVIEYNHVYNIGRGLLTDMGCLYTVGIQPGTIERHNLCHDVTRYEYGGWGLYVDDATSQITVEDNVVYHTEDGGYHNQYGQDNVVRNNIFALGKNSQVLRTRLAQHISFTFEHNIVYWKEGALLRGAGPGNGLWDQGKVAFDHNLYWQAAGQPIRFGNFTFEEWQKRGQDEHSLIADPLFVDPEHGNFSLRPGSPIAKTGFRPIDLSTVGPRSAK